jgi:hypothetical protein
VAVKVEAVKVEAGKKGAGKEPVGNEEEKGSQRVEWRPPLAANTVRPSWRGRGRGVGWCDRGKGWYDHWRANRGKEKWIRILTVWIRIQSRGRKLDR